MEEKIIKIATEVMSGFDWLHHVQYSDYEELGGGITYVYFFGTGKEDNLRYGLKLELHRRDDDMEHYGYPFYDCYLYYRLQQNIGGDWEYSDHYPYDEAEVTV